MTRIYTASLMNSLDVMIGCFAAAGAGLWAWGIYRQVAIASEEVFWCFVGLVGALALALAVMFFGQG